MRNNLADGATVTYTDSSELSTDWTRFESNTSACDDWISFVNLVNWPCGDIITMSSPSSLWESGNNIGEYITITFPQDIAAINAWEAANEVTTCDEAIRLD